MDGKGVTVGPKEGLADVVGVAVMVGPMEGLLEEVGDWVGALVPTGINRKPSLVGGVGLGCGVGCFEGLSEGKLEGASDSGLSALGVGTPGVDISTEQITG